MRFCENCGHQLDDMAAFCDNCGPRVEREGEMSGSHHKETTGKKKTKVGIIVGAVIFGIVVLAAVGGLVIYPQVTAVHAGKGRSRESGLCCRTD